MKSALGIAKRSHHSCLLQALDISPIPCLVKQNNVSLLHRVFRTDSPYRSLCAYFLSSYIVNGDHCRYSLVNRVSMSKVPVIQSILGRPDLNIASYKSSGVVDSLKYLLYQPSYNRRNSLEHRLVQLLTKAF